MKTVSVIIPCYNSSRYITQAIHSVLLQEEFILEIICIDDCSQDDTVEIIEKIRTKNGIVKLIKNDVNSGPATSRNIGLDAARGDYIAFLDSDDYWISGKIETQLLYILREGYDCVFSKFIIESDNAINKDISIKSISLNKLIFKNYISTSSVLMKKNNYRFL
ncbi:glycosyltransferase family 2 protein, partial [Citrobacter sedlakii]|uniref:glycosyltransferase family 2 protein n=1 Tax=Citrobacter sedlakii TaxID=67826 RepID=UPI003B42FD81